MRARLYFLARRQLCRVGLHDYEVFGAYVARGGNKIVVDLQCFHCHREKETVVDV